MWSIDIMLSASVIRNEAAVTNTAFPVCFIVGRAGVHVLNISIMCRKVLITVIAISHLKSWIADYREV